MSTWHPYIALGVHVASREVVNDVDASFWSSSQLLGQLAEDRALDDLVTLLSIPAPLGSLLAMIGMLDFID
jgi:hypothetical protein